MYDHLEPYEAVYKSWNVTGPSPEWHVVSQDKVRMAMPLLHRALGRFPMIVHPGAETHDEQTLLKVLDSLKESGLTDTEASIVIREMQNKGILFRERL